jgi:hypothetical protein
MYYRFSLLSESLTTLVYKQQTGNSHECYAVSAGRWCSIDHFPKKFFVCMFFVYWMTVRVPNLCPIAGVGWTQIIMMSPHIRQSVLQVLSLLKIRQKLLITKN